MDAIVTARVPVELKEQGNALLKSIGSSPTQLINAAYEFVLKEKKLPQAGCRLDDAANKARRLSPEQRERLHQSLAIMHLSPASAKEGFRARLDAVRDERYAHLA